MHRQSLLGLESLRLKRHEIPANLLSRMFLRVATILLQINRLAAPLQVQHKVFLPTANAFNHVVLWVELQVGVHLPTIGLVNRLVGLPSLLVLLFAGLLFVEGGGSHHAAPALLAFQLLLPQQLLPHLIYLFHDAFLGTGGLLGRGRLRLSCLISKLRRYRWDHLYLLYNFLFAY
jgi:hypothetical protein